MLTIYAESASLTSAIFLTSPPGGFLTLAFTFRLSRHLCGIPYHMCIDVVSSRSVSLVKFGSYKRYVS
jgi:hypothetical protein